MQDNSNNQAAFSNKAYGCIVPGCSKRYRTPTGLVTHVYGFHLFISSQPKGSGDGSGINEGVDDDVKPFACSTCGKYYRNANGLSYHISSAHNDDFATALQSAVNSGGIVVYNDQLTDANQPWNDSGYSTPHITSQSHHKPVKSKIPSNSTDSNIKPFICTIPGCNKAYKNPNGLLYHMNKAQKAHLHLM